jgi:1-acyl-sn-glycerol-3-phosphate acyltransferase
MKERLQTFFYWLHKWTWGGLLIWMMTSRAVRGRRNIPRQGPVILASNHLNLSDPPILITVTPRRITWMAKKELFDIPVFGLLYHSAGCISVRRAKADLRALRQSLQALQGGSLLGMFPEGTRGTELGLQAGEPGTALLALRSGAPVLPVAIWGTEVIRLPASFSKRTRVHIVFGEPFYLTRSERLSREQVQEGTDEIMRRIAALLPTEYRGVYGETATGEVAAGSGKDR